MTNIISNVKQKEIPEVRAPAASNPVSAVVAKALKKAESPSASLEGRASLMTNKEIGVVFLGLAMIAFAVGFIHPASFIAALALLGMGIAHYSQKEESVSPSLNLPKPATVLPEEKLSLIDQIIAENGQEELFSIEQPSVSFRLFDAVQQHNPNLSLARVNGDRDVLALKFEGAVVAYYEATKVDQSENGVTQIYNRVEV